jgi:colicin import membrane protein
LRGIRTDYARAKDQTLTILKGQIAQREKYEREQIELAALRKATEERAASDRDEQIARDAAEKARAEVEANARAAADHAAAVSKAAADAAEQRERELKQAAKDAEQHAQAEREAAAQREADAQRQIEDANRRAAETEARIKREAEEAMALEAAETARREADREHRATINRTAVAALVEGGLTEDCARMAIAAIARGQVPNVSVRY